MLIKVIKKDITKEVNDGLIIHGVNCQGVMGSGVAKAIKEKWPTVYDGYKMMAVGPSFLFLGKVQIIQVSPNLYVGNCFTQEYYGRDGKVYASVEAVRKCLTKSIKFAHHNDLRFNMPKIGCGLGGLKWDTDVLPIVTELSSEYDIPVYVYEI